MVNLPPPTLLVPRSPDEPARYQGFEIQRNKYRGRADIFKDGVAITRNNIDLVLFARFLAKIAYCVSVAKFGLNSFESFLPPLILGETGEWSHFVGGYAPRHRIIDQAKKNLHTTAHYINPESGQLSADIQLLSRYGTPTYFVVVGRWTRRFFRVHRY